MSRRTTIPTSLLKSLVGLSLCPDLGPSDGPGFGQVFRPDPNRFRNDWFYRHSIVGVCSFDKSRSAEYSREEHAKYTKLLECDALGGWAARTASGDIIVNEHAAHAFAAFQRAVYEAWDAYQDRLEEIPAEQAFSAEVLSR